MLRADLLSYKRYADKYNYDQMAFQNVGRIYLFVFDINTTFKAVFSHEIIYDQFPLVFVGDYLLSTIRYIVGVIQFMIQRIHLDYWDPLCEKYYDLSPMGTVQGIR